MRLKGLLDSKLVPKIPTPPLLPRFGRGSWWPGFLIVVALVAGTTGCATLNPTIPYEGHSGDSVGSFAPPSPSPAATAPDAKDLPEPSPPASEETGAIGLGECIELALRNNPDIAASESDIDSKRAERDIAAGERWPSIHATGGYAHYLDGQRLIAPSKNNELGYFSDDLFSADLVLALPLYKGGRITNSIKAAELLRQAAEHTLARTKEELVYNVSSVFYTILAQRRLIDSVAFSQNSLTEQLKRVNNLVDAGKAPKVDGMRTEVRLAEVTQRLLQERNVLEIQQRVLANLLGLGGEPAGAPHVNGTLEIAPSSIDLNSSLEKAFSSRPDYAAARAALEAQARKVDIARGEREPAVVLEGSYSGRWAAGGSGESSSPSSDAMADQSAGGSGKSSSPSSDAIADQSAADSFGDVGRIGVKVDVPLFEGGRIAARVRDERAKLRVAEQRLRKLELQIRLDVETGTLNATSAQERIQVTEKSIAAGKESLRIEREKYDVGRGTITDVLDVQSALLEAQTSYYRALADYDIALAQLRLAAGEDSTQPSKPNTGDLP
jgi:outer membrane protein TolC